MASIIQFNSFYPATSGTMGAAASVNDVLVIGCGSNTLNTATATISGATATMTSQQNKTGTGSFNNSLTMLTGTVTAGGTPGINTSADSDMGFAAWIVRGLSSPTKNAGNGNFGTGNPLTASITTSATCSIFTGYLNENGDNFTSWNGSLVGDSHTAGHADAFAHQLGVTATTFSPGANVTSNADNTVIVIALPESGGGGSFQPAWGQNATATIMGVG